MSDIKKSKAYKKAYQRADHLCNTMPKRFLKMISPEGEPIEQKQAFEDRLAEFKAEQKALKKSGSRLLMKKHGIKLPKGKHIKSKGINKSID